MAHPDKAHTHKANARAGKLQTVDARGLKCPLPVLQTRRALLKLVEGQALEVLCTDPVSVIDIPNLVREMGFLLAQSSECGGDFRFLIERNAGSL